MSFQQELSYKASLGEEQQAEPVGGIQAFYDHIARNLTNKYPRQAPRLGIQGIVYVRIVIENDSSISDITAIEGIGGGCDEVALDVVRNGPKWHPGTKGGKAVRSSRTFPIALFLTNNTTTIQETCFRIDIL